MEIDSPLSFDDSSLLDKTTEDKTFSSTSPSPLPSPSVQISKSNRFKEINESYKHELDHLKTEHSIWRIINPYIASTNRPKIEYINLLERTQKIISTELLNTIIDRINNGHKLSSSEKMIIRGIFYVILFGLMVENSYILMDLFQKMKRSVYFIFVNTAFKESLTGNELEKFPVDCQIPSFIDDDTGKNNITRLMDLIYNTQKIETRLEHRIDTFSMICLQFTHPTLSLNLYARIPDM